jgi:hypothetical protein
MKNEENDERLWARIVAAFLRPPVRPSARETEAFVSEFMSRLEQPEPREALWFSTGLRWLVPAVSVALAASALLITRPDPLFTPPEDVAMLAEGSGISPQTAAPTTDDLVAMVMER